MKYFTVRIAFFALLFVVINTGFIFGQSSNGEGKLLRLALSESIYPHADRVNGHQYNGKTYPVESYQDSTVLVYLPAGYKINESTDFVVFFHGWFGQVDTLAKWFRMYEQFEGSNRNAVFVMPQGAVNAPDSFGGKMEDEGGFQRFISVIADSLSKKGLSSNKIGKITLSGHSGGYRAIGNILDHGGLAENINEVLLFDGLYALEENYLAWIKLGDRKFIHIYTENGGTKENSLNMMTEMENQSVPFAHLAEKDLSGAILKENAVIFIQSDLRHAYVVSSQSQFQNFLKR